MSSDESLPNENNFPAIYVVSGGVGASGEQIALTALAQFPANKIQVIPFGNVRHISQVEEVLAQAKKSGSMILYTLVEPGLHRALVDGAQALAVPAIDLMGGLLDWAAATLGQAPLGVPGLYRMLHKDYFERVAAIEFSMAHDDGKDSQGWPAADIILLGPSRAGKTPLSLYLSVLGWKVANIPLVPGIPLSPLVFQLDPRHVIGLAIEPGQLLLHRQQRQRHLGAPGASDYVDPEKIYEETQAVLKIYRQGGFPVIDVTDKPIESSTDEIIRLITRQSKVGA